MCRIDIQVQSSTWDSSDVGRIWYFPPYGCRGLVWVETWLEKAYDSVFSNDRCTISRSVHDNARSLWRTDVVSKKIERFLLFKIDTRWLRLRKHIVFIFFYGCRDSIWSLALILESKKERLLIWRICNSTLISWRGKSEIIYKWTRYKIKRTFGG